jgi:hypothetical protein
MKIARKTVKDALELHELQRQQDAVSEDHGAADLGRIAGTRLHGWLQHSLRACRPIAPAAADAVDRAVRDLPRVQTQMDYAVYMLVWIAHGERIKQPSAASSCLRKKHLAVSRRLEYLKQSVPATFVTKPAVGAIRGG